MSDACQFLGLEGDRATRMLFAAPFGCCYRAEPSGNVDLDHQQTYCLTTKHILCPVFRRPEWDPLPDELRYRGTAVSSRRGWVWALLLLLVGLGLGALFVRGNGRAANATASLPPTAPLPVVVLPEPTNTPAPTETAVPTSTPSPTATTAPSATPTAVPTFTPTSTILPTWTPLPTAAPVETAVPPLLAEIIVPKLNVRLGPGTDYPILATLDGGEVLTLVGQTKAGDWWQICCIDGEPGWVFGETLLLPDGASAAPIITDLPPTPPPQESEQ
jgi:hypothetical protein